MLSASNPAKVGLSSKYSKLISGIMLEKSFSGETAHDRPTDLSTHHRTQNAA